MYMLHRSSLTTAVQSQNAVSAHFTSEHILPLQRGYRTTTEGDAYSEAYVYATDLCRSVVGRPIHTVSRCRPTHQ